MSKKLFFACAIIITALGFTSCKDDRYTLHISDDVNILTEQDKAKLHSLFSDSAYNATYLFTAPDNLTYEEAMSYRSPNDEGGWKAFRVYYFPHQKWIRVYAPADRENIFQQKCSLPLYHIQHNADAFSDDIEDILLPVLTDIAEITSEKPSSVSTIGSSILSVVEFLNEFLILPSDNFFHLLFFRIPFCLSLIWIYLFGGTGWPIAIAVLLLIAISIVRVISKQHVRIFSILYVIHFLVFICLIFLTVPSYDTMHLVRDLGFTQTSAILDAAYMRTEAMGHTWLGGIVFIILFLIHRIWGYYLQNDPLGGKTEAEQLDRKSQVFGDNFLSSLFMFILVFTSPKYIVWAVCAYLFQQIICSDTLRQNKPEGKQVSSTMEAAALIWAIYLYFMIMIIWWICTFDNIGVTYQWAFECFSSPYIRFFIFFIASVAFIGYFILMYLYLFELDNCLTLSIIHNYQNTEESQDKLIKSGIRILYYTLSTWGVALLFLWLVAVIGHANTSPVNPSESKTIIVGNGDLPYTNQIWYCGEGDSLKLSVDKYIRQNKYLTSVAYTHYGWLFSAANKTGYTRQVYQLTNTWPSDWIKTNWNRSYRITSLSCSLNEWMIIMSKGSNYQGQAYVSKKSDEILSWWYSEKEPDYFVTDLSFNNGKWLIVSSQTKKYTKQRYLWATINDVQQKIQEEIWDKNCNIQLMEYGGGQYLIFYGADSYGKHAQTYWRNTSDISSATNYLQEHTQQIMYIGGGYDSIPSTQAE